MNSFYTAIQHLGKLRDFCYVFDGDPFCAEERRCPPSGNQFNSEFLQAFGEGRDTGFIRDTQERALNFWHGKDYSDTCSKRNASGGVIILGRIRGSASFVSP